ncbi:hypothetical protein [Sphingomonas alpina]|uniref:Uncharacterized protein n=1 Tax=Sphingomonas alpina TaxID=653931 RepID=A0A7H0LPI1_9SPHN|nr:hypothetical protein [Sphingomonas alpina]QNQ11584.1 hypothetical protein H3Z74_10870 [Sphingomonas alpina]
MADAPSSATDRIEVAIARIEAAMAARARATEVLAIRHEALRSRMIEAIAALDDIIAQEDED